MVTGSTEDVVGPESEFGGSAARPGDGHRDRAAAQFDVQVCTRRLRCDGQPRRRSHRQRQRDELACLSGRLGVTALGHLAPAMNDVGIIPFAMAILATDAPNSAHCATTCTFVIVLYRRVHAFSLVIVSS